MSDTAVVAVTFVVSYGAILGYAIYLHMRGRGSGS